MAKGLNILTHAAQTKGADRRKYPRCAECNRPAGKLADGTFQKHCYIHRTDAEWNEFKQSWMLK